MLFAQAFEVVLWSDCFTHLQRACRKVHGVERVLQVVGRRTGTCHKANVATLKVVCKHAHQYVVFAIKLSGLCFAPAVDHQAVQTFINKQCFTVELFADFKARCAFLTS